MLVNYLGLKGLRVNILSQWQFRKPTSLTMQKVCQEYLRQIKSFVVSHYNFFKNHIFNLLVRLLSSHQWQSLTFLKLYEEIIFSIFIFSSKICNYFEYVVTFPLIRSHIWLGSDWRSNNVLFTSYLHSS